MRALLFCSILVSSANSLACPPQYELTESRCIRVLEHYIYDTLDNLLPTSRTECAKDGAHLPIIKNDEDNDIYSRIVHSFQDQYTTHFLVLDLVCNQATRRLEWIDGSPVTYSRKDSIDFNFDCVTTKQTAIKRENVDDWYLVNTVDKHYYAMMCVLDGLVLTTGAPTTKQTDTPIELLCGEYSLMNQDDDKPCYKVFANSLSWNQANGKCAADFGSLITINSAEENKFYWRTAITYGIVDGMHIGAHQSKEDPSTWTWSDGEVPIAGKAYDNFVSSFPIPGVGECSSMMTETSTGLWVNENCDKNEQPFICRRADFSTVSTTCPNVAPEAGKDFFPPGFPDPDTPCEYLLFVSAKKLVELEVKTLVCDDNEDYLEILEGTSGPHPIANLTGTVLSPLKFKTTESNVMRVNWKPNGEGKGRGFRIQYNEVDA